MDYYKHSYISQSDIKTFISSPSLFHYTKVLGKSVKNEDKLQDIFNFGNLVDTLVFEPEVFKDRFYVGSVDRRTTEGKKKALEIENNKQIIVSDNDFKKAQEMIKNLKENEMINHLLFGPNGQNQLEFYTTDFRWENIQGFKCRTDRVITDLDKKLITIVDYKTSSCKNPKEFIHSVKSFGYHIQDAFYTNMCKSSGFDVEFIFIVQPKEAPYKPFTVQLSENTRKIGQQIYENVLDKMNECFKTDVWEYEDVKTPKNESGHYVLDCFNY